MHRIASRMPEHGPPSPPSANLKGFATTTPFMIKAERVVVFRKVGRSAINGLRAANNSTVVPARFLRADGAIQVIHTQRH